MDKDLKRTIGNVRALANSALGTLQELDSQLIGVADEEAEHIFGSFKEAPGTIEGIEVKPVDEPTVAFPRRE
jgi:hypothetical protein